MAKKRKPKMTQTRWLKRARSAQVKQQVRAGRAQKDFQAIIEVAARQKRLDWKEAVALLHMVYGWMPTMLRPIEPHTRSQRRRLLAHLKRVREGKPSASSALADVQRFANRSIIGASKLLHVLSPKNYVIWDSRVADAFLWKGVTRGTYATVARYEEYLDTVGQWAKDPRVIRRCASLRTLNPALARASDLRLIELVLYCRT